MAGKNGILTWRPPSEQVELPLKTTEKKSPSGPQAPKKQGDRSEKIVLHSLLKPRESQRTVLDALFAGPLLLRKLLSAAAVKPRSAEEAALFLLMHHKELQPCLYATENRERSVDLLKRLIVDWALNIPELIELEFPGDCSISATHQVFLPIPRLGTLPVKDEAELVEHMRGRRYSRSFVLIHSAWGYISEISFTGRPANLTTKTPRAPRVGHIKAGDVSQVGRIKFDHYLMMFDSEINARLMNELRVAKRFATPDFSALEGREVLGGLPSLGKRR